MHYNIESLINQYDKKVKIQCELYVSDIDKLFDISIKSNKLGFKDIAYRSISNGWKAGYMAGYNKAKREAQKKG